MLVLLQLFTNFSASATNSVLLHGEILGKSFAITQSQIIYWGLAALVGIIAEFLVGWRLPLGIIGAIAASLLGVWLFTDVISIEIAGDITVAGQSFPIVKAFIGAVVVTLWHLLTYPAWRRRDRYNRGYRRNRDAYRRNYDY
jgi:uncharacterized membrane protein YeaQ/YmgE (transglycosylase-associated protein family)